MYKSDPMAQQNQAKTASCKHCTKTYTSFGQYVSTYCHFIHKHLAGFGKKPLFSQCERCDHYQRREVNKHA